MNVFELARAIGPGFAVQRRTAFWWVVEIVPRGDFGRAYGIVLPPRLGYDYPHNTYWGAIGSRGEVKNAGCSGWEAVLPEHFSPDWQALLKPGALADYAQRLGNPQHPTDPTKGTP